jgi:hypothetical protein
MNTLLDIVKQSSEQVEKQNWRYYYQADEYKFNNVFLASWYEHTYNSWATFVDKDVDKIKQKLTHETFDPTVNYELEYLRKTRNENDYVQLYFSGGADSLTLLELAVENDVYIDELVIVATGDSLNLPENQEIVQSAIPAAEKYAGKYGKYTVKQTTLDHFKTLFRDPYCYFTQPDVGSQFPTFRRHWYSSGVWDNINGVRLLACDKPQLVYYNNRWYTVFVDVSLNGKYASSGDGRSHFTKFEVDNIFSLIKDSLDYRDYLLEHNPPKNNLQFFKLNNLDDNNIINRAEPEDKSILFPKGHAHVSPWNSKDSYGLEEVLKKQDVRLMVDYFAALDTMLKNAYPTHDYQSVELAPKKFAWFIDIDSKIAYTQRELIPNGFEI